MRILLVGQDFSASGAGHLLLRLALHLKAAGHAVAAACIDAAPGRLQRAYAEAGVTLVREVSPEAFDVCLANTVACAPLVLALGRRVPIVWWLHEAEVGFALILQNPAWAGAFAEAAGVVFQSAWQLDDVYRSFVHRLDPARLHVIANGPAPPPAALPAVAARRAALRVVSVGTVYPRKRHGDVIAALAALRGRLDAELVVCGAVRDGLDLAARRAVAERPDRLRLTGEVDHAEALAWIASADVFCLASDSESDPLTVLEAGLFARPLVLSDIPAYAGALRHGRDALMFPVGDVELLAEALAFLAARPERRRRLGEAARARASARSEAAMLARLGELLARFARRGA